MQAAKELRNREDIEIQRADETAAYVIMKKEE